MKKQRKRIMPRLAVTAAAALCAAFGMGGAAYAQETIVCTDGNGHTYIYLQPEENGIEEFAVYSQLGEPAGEIEALADEAGIAVDSINFPDKKFRDYVSKQFDKDSNGYLSDSEISAATVISVNNMGISSLKGVEYFTDLTGLFCNDNLISSIDVSKNTALYSLNCYNNRLKSLDVSKNTALTYLSCDYNNLTSLNVSNNKALKDLSCIQNKLTSLDVSGHSDLKVLWCSSNKLVSLNISGDTALAALHCDSNNLKSLDISSNAALEEIYCNNNYFSSKSDIIGLNEEALRVCECNTQYYEGYEHFYYSENGSYSLSSSKMVTGGNVSGIHVNYTPDASDSGKTIGIPDEIVTEDGIVFVASMGHEVIWSSSDSNKLKIAEPGSWLYYTAYEPGDYVLTMTVKNYDGNGGVLSKDFPITVIDKEMHTEHEFSENYTASTHFGSNGFIEKEVHSKECFCGERTDEQPHTYDDELLIVPQPNGANIFCKHCSICNYRKTVGGENSQKLVDDETNVELTILDGTVIDENARLFVTDVTDTEEVDIEGKAAVYDISLKSDNVEIQPNGNIAVTLPVPETVDGSKAKVFRKETDGKYTDMKAVYNPQSKTLSFVTNHLSIYVVARGEDDVKKGDVNGDSSINNRDVTALRRIFADGDTAPAAADMNGDGEINNKDLTALRRYLVDGE